jgi:hypothetical protein
MTKLHSDQLERIEICAAEMGQRGNAIAQALNENLLGGKSIAARRDAVTVGYALLWQLAASFNSITGGLQAVAREALTPEKFEQLEQADRELADKGNGIAKGIVMAIDQVPDRKEVALLSSHAQVFQLLTVLEMALNSKVGPTQLKANIAARMTPPQTAATAT